MIDLIRQYNEEKRKWKKAGKPMRSAERIAEIHDNICSKCPLFKKGQGYLPGYDLCGECKCNLHRTALNLNKLAWATTKCPLKTPKFEAEAGKDEV